MNGALFSGAKLTRAATVPYPNPNLGRAPTMAPPPRHLKMAPPLKCASISAPTLKLSPFPELDSHLKELRASLINNIASIRTVFLAPDNPEINGSHLFCAGVFLDPTLVVTSASVVASVAAVRGAGSPVYRSYVGSTAALAYGSDSPIDLQPVAVSFARDVAVLRVVDRGGPLLPYCPTAASPPDKESLLMSISYDLEDQESGWGGSLANVRSAAGRTIKSKAPWPLDDGLPWLEHDWLMFHGGPPPPSSVLFNCKEKVTGSITKLSGSPWFNLYGELVGIASWVLRDDPACFSVGYAAPLSSIRAVVEYAETKGAEDRIVMDRWIESEVTAADWDEV